MYHFSYNCTQVHISQYIYAFNYQISIFYIYNDTHVVCLANDTHVVWMTLCITLDRIASEYTYFNIFHAFSYQI